MLKKLNTLVVAAGLALTASCVQQSSELSLVTSDGLPTLSEDERTFQIMSVQLEEDAVVYTVLTPSHDIRTLPYTDDGLTGVFDESGSLVAGRADVTPTISDGLIAALNLPAHPDHGYAALGIDRPLPSARPATDAVIPEQIAEQPYGECERSSTEWTGSDGCTYGVFIDSCPNNTYWGYYQKRSGCFLGLFNCDCPGDHDGGLL